MSVFHTAGRLLARTLLCLMMVAVVVVVAVVAVSEYRLRRTWPVRVSLASPEPALAARGLELARSRGCTDCHGDALAGKVVIDEMPFARIVATPLAPRVGEASTRVHERLYRALHHGVDMRDRSLLMMPSTEYASLSAHEIEAIAAHVVRLPPVQAPVQRSQLGPIARGLLAAGKLEGFLPAEHIDHQATAIAHEPAPDSPGYGAHVARLCMGCHQPDLAGGRMKHGGPDAPHASNLTPYNARLAAWTRDDFVRAMRTGRRPDGTQINGRYMPWRAIGQSSDAELHAVWAYLQTLPSTARKD